MLQKQFLIYPPDNSFQNLFPLKPIKIESPEQFVPLYLAYLGEDCYTRYLRDFLVSASSLSSTVGFGDNARAYINSTGEENQKKFEAALREDLLALLDIPYPSEYVFPVPENTVIGEHGGPPPISSQHMVNSFKFGYFYGDLNLISGPGVIVKFSSSPWAAMSNGFYDSFRLALRSVNTGIHIVYLTLVKAKHIPLLRARIYLGLPVVMPYSDMRILRGQGGENRVDTGLRDLGTQMLNKLLETSGLKEEWLSQDEMRKFIMATPTQKTSTELIDDTLAAKGYGDLIPRT